MARVVPAAPDTSTSLEAVIEPAAMLPQPEPTSSVAFSWRVMAASTSSILSLVSWGCAAALRAQLAAANNKRDFFII